MATLVKFLFKKTLDFMKLAQIMIKELDSKYSYCNHLNLLNHQYSISILKLDIGAITQTNFLHFLDFAFFHQDGIIAKEIRIAVSAIFYEILFLGYNFDTAVSI